MLIKADICVVCPCNLVVLRLCALTKPEVVFDVVISYNTIFGSSNEAEGLRNMLNYFASSLLLLDPDFGSSSCEKQQVSLILED